MRIFSGSWSLSLSLELRRVENERSIKVARDAPSDKSKLERFPRLHRDMAFVVNKGFDERERESLFFIV